MSNPKLPSREDPGGILIDVFLCEGLGCENSGDEGHNGKNETITSSYLNLELWQQKSSIYYFLNRQFARGCVSPNQPSKYLPEGKLIEDP